MSQRYLQAHCQSRTSQPARQSFVKELAKPTQRKIETVYGSRTPIKNNNEVSN